ncbi:secretin N-terminal domain-containing protein [Candidatus Omnitrophota bacterium]
MVKRIIIYTGIFLISVFSMIPLVKGQYENQAELISLDLKGMDIRDVLKILSQKSGLNIVADRDVKGTIALYVRDVDIMDALDIIASTNGLAYEEEGTLIRVMTDGKYERLHGARFRDESKTEIVKLSYAEASKVAEVVKQMKTASGKIVADDRSSTIVLIDSPGNVKRMKDAISEMDVALVTEVFSLDYAKAEPIKDKLERMVSEDTGSVRFDKRTNKVVVKDTPKKVEDIKKVIKAFDEKPQEVVIDANIIQVTLSDKYSYGINWDLVAAQLADVQLTGSTNLITGLTGTSPSTLTIATTGGHYSSVLSLLKTFGETNVLSKPSITVLDGEEAKILVGSKEVFVSSEVTTTSGGTYHTTDHVNFIDVGVKLAVRPEINKAGYIRLKIKPEVSEVDSTKTVTLKNPDGSTRTRAPYINTSEAETTVVIKDKATLVIGGLMKDTVIDHNEKVPFFSEIPMLGKLFSTTGKSKEKTELVIFLTPRIIEGDETTKEARYYLDRQARGRGARRTRRPRGRLAPRSFRTSKREDRKGLRPKASIKPKAPKEKWPSILGTPRKTQAQPQMAKGGRNIHRVSEKKAPSKKTPYENYYLMIREEINNAASKQDVSGLKGEVEMQFTLDKKGFITRGPVVLNNPDLKLVRAAVNCVKKTSPFPHFSKDMKKERAELSVVVRYK